MEHPGLVYVWLWFLLYLQGDAGGLAVGYVDLDFQVPPVCPLALPIQP